MLGSDGSLLVAQDKDIGGDDALKLRQKSEVGPSLNSNSPCIIINLWAAEPHRSKIYVRIFVVLLRVCSEWGLERT